MSNETGIQELRRLVRMANGTREDAFDGLDAIQTVRLLQACHASGLHVLPDELGPLELRYAATHGRLHTMTVSRLNRAAGPA